MESYSLLVYALAYMGLFLLSFYLLSFFQTRKIKIIEEKSDKTVTILIPAYNEERDIARTLKSVLNIDYPKDKLEIIVIDDGSKDKTYEIARKFASDRVKVFTKKNGGKAAALNFALKKAKGEIIVSMDADTIIEKHALKRLITRFYDDNVMAVTSAMGIYKPKTIWQRIQHIEYYLSVFMRKTFAGINAIYITSGAFSAYRKKFFDRHGGYDEHNITEDLEIALRIQSHDYVIENASTASFYTVGPATFSQLMFQRRRWYTGLVKNLWNYRRKLFGFKKGALGTIILPSVIIGVVFSVALFVYSSFRILNQITLELDALNAVNFQFIGFRELNSYIFTQFLYAFFSHPAYLFLVFFIFVTGFYLAFSRREMQFRESLKVNFIIFILLYSFLFTFWWLVSFAYIVLNRGVSWGKKDGK
ncbi:MAG: glycosyltransferase [Nanoarchaeota archaeon]